MDQKTNTEVDEISGSSAGEASKHQPTGGGYVEMGNNPQKDTSGSLDSVEWEEIVAAFENLVHSQDIEKTTNEKARIKVKDEKKPTVRSNSGRYLKTHESQRCRSFQWN